MADYRVRFAYKSGVHHDPVVDLCREAGSLAAATRTACAGRGRDGKMFAQDTCINPDSRQKMIDALLERQQLIAGCRDFDVLHDIIAAVAPKGCGRLMCYNLTNRIGAYLDLTPQNYLYIHAGPLKGWKRLTGERGNSFRVAMSQVPAALRALTPAQIEDALCEYAELLNPGFMKTNATR